MTDKPENPPAFPEILSAWVWEKNEEGVLEMVKNNRTLTQPGMTLRDYFAAAALQGFCANIEEFNLIMNEEEDQIEGRVNLCVRTYLIADAMLKARQS